jgi:hypothetical protein
VAVLFRLNSAKKWRLALEQKLLPEAVRRWLGIGELADFVEKATVDWIPPQVFMDTLTWQVIECLTRCGVPQPIAVVRQTVGDLLLRGSKVSQNGLVLDRRFWRTFAARSTRPCSAEVAEECRQRIDFVLGQVDLSEELERRWLDGPELSGAERAKLEAVRVAQPCERLQALQEAQDEGCFDFVTNLLAYSYSRCGRRAHHPLLLWVLRSTKRMRSARTESGSIASRTFSHAAPVSSGATKRDRRTAASVRFAVGARPARVRKCYAPTSTAKTWRSTPNA